MSVTNICCQIKLNQNERNEFTNRILELVANIPACILYFLPNTYQNIRTTLSQPKARHPVHL